MFYAKHYSPVGQKGKSGQPAHAGSPTTIDQLSARVCCTALALCCAGFLIALPGCSAGTLNTSAASTNESEAAASADSSASAEEPELTAEEAAAAAAQAARAAAFTTLSSQLDTLLAPYGEDVAVSYLSTDGTLGYSSRGDVSYISASMIKLLILSEFIRQVDLGIIRLDDTYTLNYDDVVSGAGVIQFDAPGTVYSYDTLALYMISESDNTASNVLIDILGKDAINTRATQLGLTGTRLNRKLMVLDSDTQNYIAANDAATILRGIANHTLGSEAMCTRAEEYLLAQTDVLGLAQGLPADTAFGHKTGSLTLTRHDGGIVYSSDPYVIVVLTTLSDAEANSLMEQITSTITETMGA